MELSSYEVPNNICVGTAFVLAEWITWIYIILGSESTKRNWRLSTLFRSAVNPFQSHEHCSPALRGKKSQLQQTWLSRLFNFELGSSLSSSDIIRTPRGNCKLNFLSREAESYEKIINVSTSCQKYEEFSILATLKTTPLRSSALGSWGWGTELLHLPKFYDGLVLPRERVTSWGNYANLRRESVWDLNHLIGASSYVIGLSGGERESATSRSYFFALA